MLFVVGIAAGFGSGLLTRLVYFCEDAFLKLPIHWMWWPAIGAVFVGLGGWYDPRVLGVGYDLIHGLLRGEIIGAALLSLVILKALVWSISLGSGTSGGVLAPLLIIGGALGAVLGQWLPVGDTGLWADDRHGRNDGRHDALAADRDVLPPRVDARSRMRCPLCSARRSPPSGVTVLMMRRSILTEKLARRGQHIAREYSVDLFELMRVGDVMDRDVVPMPANTPLPRYSARIASGDPLVCGRQGTLLADENGALVGIITRGDVVRAFELSRDERVTVLEAGQTNLVVAYPDETLHDAIARMLGQGIGRLPVVERNNPRKVVGYLGRAGILAARARYHREEDVRERGFRVSSPTEAVSKS